MRVQALQCAESLEADIAFVPTGPAVEGKLGCGVGGSHLDSVWREKALDAAGDRNSGMDFERMNCSCDVVAGDPRITTARFDMIRDA